jgi:hypothetical protein
MTLVMELCDATTGQVFARLVDVQTGAMGALQFPDTVTNNREFLRIVRAWAQRLRTDLDKMSRQSS